jgi:acetylornithine deacetylase/succinyl-diaminopimelate desuccinylase-like protein
MTAVEARAALRLAESRREELVSLLSHLIAAASPYGSSGAEAQNVLARFLERHGFAVTQSRDDPGGYRNHPDFMPPPVSPGKNAPPINLVARLREEAEMPLLFFAHVDTEPLRPASAPEEAVVREGKLYGAGAADDKGGLAAAAFAAAILAESLGRAPRLLSVHGKGGGSRGSLPAFARLEAGPKAAVYVHPAETGRGMSELKISCRGVLDVRLAVRGWRGAPLEIGTPESAPLDGGGDALAACLELIRELRETDLAGSVVQLGRIEGGDGPGLVPDRALAELRILFDEPHTTAGVLAAFGRAAEDYALRHATGDVRFRIEVTSAGRAANPASVPWNAQPTLVLRRVIEEITGNEPKPYAAHLASDIRFPIRLCGLPTVGIGCLAGGFYGPEEWVDLDDLVRLVAVLVRFASAWDPTDSPSP